MVSQMVGEDLVIAAHEGKAWWSLRGLHSIAVHAEPDGRWNCENILDRREGFVLSVVKGDACQG